MPLDTVTSSSQRRVPLPLSTPLAINTLMKKLALCISMLLCDLEKPSLVKHSQMMSMAQSPPGTTLFPSPPISPHNSPEPPPGSETQVFSRSTPWESHPVPRENFDRHTLRTSKETAEENLCLTFRFKYILLHPLQMLLRYFRNGYLKIS